MVGVGVTGGCVGVGVGLAGGSVTVGVGVGDAGGSVTVGVGVGEAGGSVGDGVGVTGGCVGVGVGVGSSVSVMGHVAVRPVRLSTTTSRSAGSASANVTVNVSPSPSCGSASASNVCQRNGGMPDPERENVIGTPGENGPVGRTQAKSSNATTTWQVADCVPLVTTTSKSAPPATLGY